MLTFPTKQGPWQPTPEQVQTWASLPLARQVILEDEFALAAAWLESKPSRQKTKRGMARFLLAWLKRAAADYSPKASAVRDEYMSWVESGGCTHTPRCGNYVTCQVVARRTR